jgi:intracellular multiplication protein IcmL
MREKKKVVKEKNVKELTTDNYKVAKFVALRNRFFFVLYRHSMLVFLSSLMSTIFAVLFLLFFAIKPVSPQYIPINPDGTYIKLEPVDVCKDDKEVQKFASEAINKLYKYDYRNYPEQLMAAAAYFTSKGWEDYLTSFEKSGTLEAVKKNKWVVSVNPYEIPVIVNKGIDAEGRCSVDLKTNINITYVGENSQNPRGELHIRVKRQSVIINDEGLGIERIILSTKN